MEKSEIYAIASQIAANCSTCSQVAERFNKLVADYGKDDAKAIQAQAKALVKESKLSIKVQSDATIAYLGSNNVAKVAFREFCETDPNGEFAKLVVSMKCNNDVDEFVRKYAPYYTEIDGVIVILNKVAKYDEDGERISGEFDYKVKNVDTAIGYLSALKNATKGAKRCALGASLSDVSKFIPVDEVTLPEK